MNTKLLKKVLASTLALSMVLPIGVVNADKQNTQQEKSQQVTRISGKDRITTSVEISKSAYTTSENVVLASGFNFADALSAGQLASATFSLSALATSSSYHHSVQHLAARSPSSFP